MIPGSDSVTRSGSRAPLALPRILASNAGMGEWFLTAAERGNTATRLDSRRRDGAAWTTGNQVRLLLHGVAVYGVENRTGTPIYVHAKVCVIDDTWAIVGSSNINRRSWTYDTELSCAVLGQHPDESSLARRLRLDLAREHLDRSEADDADLRDPLDAFGAFAASAQRLDDWYAGGRRGPRPPGRLRRHHRTPLPAATQRWAEATYRILYDPEGRPRPLRRGGTF